MPIHLTPESNPVVQEGTLYVDSATGEFNVAGRTTPHIIPGVLYPAVAGKLLDGTTDHGTGTYNGVSVSTNYGTTQSDGRKYYYTDIKGSKPIKDPRIGGYFGSQRHKTKSVQLLEQETATHGKNVYSIDGREWMRAVGSWYLFNDLNTSCGVATNSSNVADIIEIVGYFSTVNLIMYTDAADRSVRVTIDGGTESGTVYAGAISTTNPLASRFVDSGMLHQLTTSTLGLHTIKIRKQGSGSSTAVMAIELIAQDTTSTANRSKIQIPSQNVVSYGKKFTVSGTPHYDPFNGFTSGNLALVQALGIDTDTSLGLSKWLPSDAGTTYYRPFNGGRIIKWVDSSGVIKTSVNMMPPNAKSIAGTNNPTNAFAERTTASHFGTNNAMNSFEAGTDLDSDQLSEVAKTFYTREFGNGNANGGSHTGSENPPYADASMLSGSSDNITYVMDDGLTSLSGDTVRNSSQTANSGIHYQAYANTTNKGWYLTFIGTGLTFTGRSSDNYEGLPVSIVQNLPYGTHVVKIFTDSSSHSTTIITVDGVQVHSGTTATYYAGLGQVTFHQPKKPPIPEDACVIADYMLMADFVAQSAVGVEKISKGVRRLDASRDMFYNGSSLSLAYNSTNFRAFTRVYSSSNNKVFKIPSFGRGGIVSFYGANDKAQGLTFKINGTTASGTTNYNHYGLGVTGNSALGTFDQRTSSNTAGKFLGAVHKTEISTGGVELSDTTTEQMTFECIDLVSPIHTSSHYQSFETPFLHELVGGDRNMEQHNLVVSPFGKSWDEVTRDTSYIGSPCVNANTDQGGVIIDEWRGAGGSADPTNYFNKDWAIAYDRIICLKSGMYEVSVGTLVSNGHLKVWFNSTSANQIIQGHDNTGNSSVYGSAIHHFQRGDYIAFQSMNSSTNYNTVTINRL